MRNGVAALDRLGRRQSTRIDEWVERGVVCTHTEYATVRIVRAEPYSLRVPNVVECSLHGLDPPPQRGEEPRGVRAVGRAVAPRHAEHGHGPDRDAVVAVLVGDDDGP